MKRTRLNLRLIVKLEKIKRFIEYSHTDKAINYNNLDLSKVGPNQLHLLTLYLDIQKTERSTHLEFSNLFLLEIIRRKGN